MKTFCEEVTVFLTVRTIDDQGRTIRKVQTQPVEVLRANAADFWAEVDKATKQIVKEQHEQEAAKAKQGRSAPPDAVKGKRR